MTDQLIYTFLAAGLVFFLGMLYLALKALSIAHDLAKIVLQAGLTPQVATVPKLPTQPIPKVPATAPAPSIPFAGAPPWFLAAERDIGFHETGDNQGIEEFIAQAHTGKLGDPWCAIFANAKLEQEGIPGTRSPAALSFRTDPGYVKLPGPALGAIGLCWRGSPTSGLGHVFFYWGENATLVWGLGGNENNMVQVEAMPKSSSTFGLIGYWWPKSVPLPTIGPILMPAGSPTSIQTVPVGITPTPAAPTETPIVDQGLVNYIKGKEGFSAKAYWDYKQYSIGYGTKANSPTEVIDEPEAVRRLTIEINLAEQEVEKFAPNAPKGVKQALTDLVYNAGVVWEGQDLGALIKAGSYEEAKSHVLQYNHAGKPPQVLAGLTTRRQDEVSWFDNPL